MKPGKEMKVSYQRLSQDIKEIEAAGSAVARLKARKLLKPASAYPCVVCYAQAEDYHHPSYRPDDRYCVIPLCTKCHYHVHRSNLQLPRLGIVPTSVGLVRIAIAGLATP